MTLLNYTSEYSKINQYLKAANGSSDWLRIFVSPEASGGGHFITHGIDFSANYAAGIRGLVPTNTATDLTKTFFRGDGWKSFWNLADETASAVGDTAAQKLAAKEAYLQSTIASAYDTKQWIQQSFAANDAMRFKGTISVDSNDNITHNTSGTSVSGFPTSCEVGDTYKVTGTTNRTLANQNVNSGDMLICIKDGSGSAINTSEYWTVVQSNVENLITYNLNGTAFHLYSSEGRDIKLYAPTTEGAAGQVLVSSGSKSKSPIWKNANTLVVAQAGKVTNALSKGAGLSFKAQGVETASYNGSAAITIALLPATSSTIGGVIIDGGTNSEAYKASTNTNGTAYPTISANSTGEIYLSKQNIINALGFTPEGSSKGVTKVIVGSAATSNANTTTVTANPYINIVANDNSILGSYRISGSGKISVNSTANSAALTVSLGVADSSNYGGIKIGYTTSGKNYAVQLSDGKAFVNVPWISDIFTASANGLAPAASDANKSTAVTSATYLLGADAKWHKLPASAFQSDRRIVQLGGTTVIGASSGNALNVVAGKHVNISAEQSSGNYTGKLTFNAIWRDVQVHLISGSTIGSSVATIGDNDPLVFDNSESVFMLGEQVTSGSTKKTVIKSYITWYNMDTGEYEIV